MAGPPEGAVPPEPAVAPPEGPASLPVPPVPKTNDCVHDGQCGSGLECEKGRCLAMEESSGALLPSRGHAEHPDPRACRSSHRSLLRLGRLLHLDRSLAPSLE